MIEMVIVPHVSEKTVALGKERNTYAFRVPLDANKHQIADAVAKAYSVTVKSVRVSINKGKQVMSYRKSRPVYGTRSDTKTAYVTLADGSAIKMFEEEQ